MKEVDIKHRQNVAFGECSTKNNLLSGTGGRIEVAGGSTEPSFSRKLLAAEAGKRQRGSTADSPSRLKKKAKRLDRV